jgi:hypothetical protein
VHFFVRRFGSKAVILEFQAFGSDMDIRFDDWEFPVPRIGERVWLNYLMKETLDDPHWVVEDVWWFPEAADGEPVVVVFIERKEE